MVFMDVAANFKKYGATLIDVRNTVEFASGNACGRSRKTATGIFTTLVPSAFF
jgi:hypothetical protein